MINPDFISGRRGGTVELTELCPGVCFNGQTSAVAHLGGVQAGETLILRTNPL